MSSNCPHVLHTNGFHPLTAVCIDDAHAIRTICLSRDFALWARDGWHTRAQSRRMLQIRRPSPKPLLAAVALCYCASINLSTVPMEHGAWKPTYSTSRTRSKARADNSSALYYNSTKWHHVG